LTGLNGTASSGVTYNTASPKFGSADFSTPTTTPGAYISIPVGAGTNATTWTWEAWFKSSVTPSAIGVIVGGGLANALLGYIGIAASGGFPVFNVYAGNATITGPTSVCDGNWHHLAFVANGS
jgi:hypothetical protein